ncbi:hypothetical protein VFPBJ_10312 [Purpureocillium lilacinum]|uniref:Uncharacterized protein n=1 Tax=Purpureocillium lilacinum TaxID=33203 RepID=A0A179G2C4_PURLI|nr:hypothetical protein VFPBJ_10312 [Purpureocillium lilacinum]
MINGTMSRPSSNAAGTRGALRALYMSDRVRRPRLQGPHPRYAPSMSRTRRFRVGLSSRLGSPAFGAGKWALRGRAPPQTPHSGFAGAERGEAMPQIPRSHLLPLFPPPWFLGLFDASRYHT